MKRLVYLSPIPWASFAQRPHKFVEWFHARHGGEVLWLDPYPTRLPKWADLLRAKTISNSTQALFTPVPSWLKVLQPSSLPLEPIPGAVLLNILLWQDLLLEVGIFLSKPDALVFVGKPSSLALHILTLNSSVPSFYDAMDDFPAFYVGLSRRAMERKEHAVAEKVSKIFASSTALAERFNVHSAKVSLVLNACDSDSLPKGTAAQSPIGDRQIVLGYIGTIGFWFDWQLVVAIANACPSYCIRLIGPIYTPPPSSLPANIEILPPCDHSEAMRAVQLFTVGLIPFKCVDLTASVDPIKYYEYRALSLPIISTRFGEMALRGDQNGVFLTDNSEDLVSVVARALDYNPEETEIKKFRNENSWSARFDNWVCFD